MPKQKVLCQEETCRNIATHKHGQVNLCKVHYEKIMPKLKPIEKLFRKKYPNNYKVQKAWAKKPTSDRVSHIKLMISYEKLESKCKRLQKEIDKLKTK